MSLTVVIATLNEAPAELNATIKSIRDTAGDKPEILLIDDCSSTPVAIEDKSVKVIHNRWRCGVGPSRHIGVEAANGKFVLITDAHMRFKKGWYEAAMSHMEGRPNTVHCATCLGLDRTHLDINAPVSRYHGGTINFYGPDRNKAGKMQVFEPIWLPKEQEPANDDEIPCVLGACYFIPRDWFLKISPLRYLKHWGLDEPLISIKTWLAGGCVRMMKEVEIGHVFWNDQKPVIKKQFSVPAGYVNFNKLFAIYTLCDAPLAEVLHRKLKEVEDSRDMAIAELMLREDWRIVATEQADNFNLFAHGIRGLAEKFNLALPA